MSGLPPIDDRFIAALKERLNRSEDPWVERKPEPKDGGRDIRRTMVAFANSVSAGEHAVLFVGASNKGSHPGVSNPDELQTTIRRIAQEQCYPAIIFQVVPFMTVVGDRDVAIVAVVIPASTNRPHFSGAAYVRVGSESLEASSAMFAELIASQNDKTRALQHMKGKTPVRVISMRVKSPRGLWYEFSGRIGRVDAHMMEVCAEPGNYWSVPLDDVTIVSTDDLRPEIELKSRGSEAEHMEAMLHRWVTFEWSRYASASPDNFDSDYILKQLLPHIEELFGKVMASGWDKRPQGSAEHRIFIWCWNKLSPTRRRFLVQ